MAARSGLRSFDLARFWADERGATAIEYALICGLIFVVIVTSVTVFGNHTVNIIKNESTAIGTAIG